MCGIFGYIAKHGRGPDLARLRRIALETETRGRDRKNLMARRALADCDAWLGRKAAAE